jgi:hypothetical protein
MSQKHATFLLLLCLSLYNLSAVAAQHALVVGINEYPHETNLKGAVNDAKLLRDTLRDIQVQLPDERVLLNAQATRANVIRAWNNMVAQAQPGDTLILTYAGHGGQEKEQARPFDEEDGKDETLILYDERITDDELMGLFEQASEYRILFVADSCHSGGLTRSACISRWAKNASRRRQRSASAFPALFKQGDEGMNLSHLTVISATHHDNVSVCEYNYEEKSHGALSWFFAKALKGKADRNQNKQLERLELEEFLLEKVSDFTNSKQNPKLQPRADSQTVVSLGGQSSTTIAPPLRPNLPPIAIKVENGSAPFGLKYVLPVNKGFKLRFVVGYRYTDVFNHTNDKIATLLNHSTALWQRLINKNRLLQALSTQFDMRLRPIQIELREGDGLHRRGDRLHFSIAPGARWQGLKALTLFNLAGNGELQFLYPLEWRNHSPIVWQFPYRLPPLGVVPPFGGDNLVAVLCTRPPTRLHKLLKTSAPYLPEPTQIISALHRQRCQVGQYAFFSGE